MLADIAPILARARDNGGPYRSRTDGDIHAASGTATIDLLHVPGHLGATPAVAPEIAGAAAILSGYQNGDGSFRYTATSARLPCVTAAILGALGRLGPAGSDMARAGFAWLAAQQQPDDGWRCATVRAGKSPATDASTPGTTLYARDAFRFADTRIGTAAAVAFLLAHWDSRAPPGPCGFGLGARFLQVEYPFLRYNLFFYVHMLAHTPPHAPIHGSAPRWRCRAQSSRMAVSPSKRRSGRGGAFPLAPGARATPRAMRTGAKSSRPPVEARRGLRRWLRRAQMALQGRRSHADARAGQGHSRPQEPDHGPAAHGLGC